MAKKTKHKDDVVVRQKNDARGAALTLPPLTSVSKRSIRGIMKDLVGQHSTEVAMRIREGLLSRNLRLALKYITLSAAYTDGKPVETHRMVGLQEGPQGTYDLSKLSSTDQKKLLKLLREAKDTTEPKGEVK